jgi:hypothetical protein
VAPCRQPARCPVYSLGATPGVGKLLRDRGAISRRSKPASFGLAILLLSQPRPLGGLPRASPIAFRVSYFTPTLHLVGATTQRLIARLAQAMEFSTHCIGALRGAPTSLHLLAATPQRLAASLIEAAGVSLHRISAPRGALGISSHSITELHGARGRRHRFRPSPVCFRQAV